MKIRVVDTGDKHKLQIFVKFSEWHQWDSKGRRGKPDSRKKPEVKNLLSYFIAVYGSNMDHTYLCGR
jgi:hypothetical protein